MAIRPNQDRSGFFCKFECEGGPARRGGTLAGRPRQRIEPRHAGGNKPGEDRGQNFGLAPRMAGHGRWRFSVEQREQKYAGAQNGRQDAPEAPGMKDESLDGGEIGKRQEASAGEENNNARKNWGPGSRRNPFPET